MTATWHYDRAGTVRRVLSDNASGVVTNRFKTTFAQDSVDVTGRVIGQYTDCDTNYDPGVTVGMTCQGWLPDRSSNRFNRLGALVIQRKDITTDTLWYDQSGNRTAAKSNTLIQNYTLGSASNRLVSQRDSLRGAIYATTRDYVYAADGGMWERHSVTPSGPDVRQLWQYDNLSRLVGRAEKPSAGAVDTSWNSCRWDGTGRNAQPCHGFQSTFVGPNVVRTSNGWFFVQAPGIDEPLLLIFRNPNTWQMQKRLQAVTDGAGQLIAIADSAGEIDPSYAGSGYGQTSWRGAGVMTRGQTFAPRRWETDAQWGEVQQFRNRAYDPGSGRWLQEDPIGVAGGINLYEYNGNDPVTWRDPFGLCPDQNDPKCKSVAQQVTDRMQAWMTSAGGRAAAAMARGLNAVVGIVDAVVPGIGNVARGLASRNSDGGRLSGRESVGLVAAGLGENAAGRLTASQATDLARYLGYARRIAPGALPFNSHGQPGFTNGRQFITQDITSHTGGTWKVFDRQGKRLGTVDELLNYKGP